MFTLPLTLWEKIHAAVESIFSHGSQIEPLPQKSASKPLTKEEIAILEDEYMVNRVRLIKPRFFGVKCPPEKLLPLDSGVLFQPARPKPRGLFLFYSPE